MLKKVADWFWNGLLLNGVEDQRICGFYALFYTFLFVAHLGIMLLLMPAFMMVIKTNYIMEFELWNMMIIFIILVLILAYISIHSIKKYFKIKTTK